jgi:hypothetical protein
MKLAMLLGATAAVVAVSGALHVASAGDARPIQELTMTEEVVSDAPGLPVIHPYHPYRPYRPYRPYHPYRPYRPYRPLDTP